MRVDFWCEARFYLERTPSQHHVTITIHIIIIIVNPSLKATHCDSHIGRRKQGVERAPPLLAMHFSAALLLLAQSASVVYAQSLAQEDRFEACCANVTGLIWPKFHCLYRKLLEPHVEE